MPYADDEHPNDPERRGSQQRLVADLIRSIDRSLDLLTETLTTVQQVQATQQKALGAQQEAINTLTEILTGREDRATLKHVPGLRDVIESLAERFSAHVDRDDRLIRNLVRYGIPAIGLLLVIPALHALGLPTDWVGKALSAASGHPQ